MYDSGEASRIITLRDLSDDVDTDKPSWSGVEYWPSQIATKPPSADGDLTRPAYLMSKDLYLSLDKAFSKIDLNWPAEDTEFDTFAETFSIVEETADWTRIKGSPAMNSGLGSRDSRISELIWQLQSLGNGVAQGGLRMYLPFLTDDIARSTAWNVAADIRQLAYSLILQSFECDTAVQEYRRSGMRVASVLIETLSDAEILAEATSLSTHMTQLLSWVGESTQLKANQAWSYLAIQYVLKYCLSDYQSLPGLEDTVRAITGRKECKWHILHLNSQFQAAFYSLRILKQILEYILSQAQETKANTQEPLGKLSALLSDLPRITVFFAEQNVNSRKEEDGIWRSVLGDLLASLTKMPDTETGVGEEGARPRKKAKKSKKTKLESSSLAENPFAMLAEE